MSGRESERGRLQGNTPFAAWFVATHGFPINPDPQDLDAARAHANAPAEMYRWAQANKLVRLWREFCERSQ